MIKAMLLAGCGGFAGTCCRYLVGRWASNTFHGSYPAGTFLVNVAGCFIIGLLLGLMERHNMLTAGQSALLVTGFCGGFTTFSTFANDIWSLGEKGDWTTSIIYLCASVIAGILLVWAGRALVR